MTCISESSLNYSVNLTPYSLYITVRKSFSKKQFQSNCKTYSLKQQLGTLEEKSKQAENNAEGGQKKSEEIRNEIKLLKEKAFHYERKLEESRKQTKAYEEIIKKCKRSKRKPDGFRK